MIVRNFILRVHDFIVSVHNFILRVRNFILHEQRKLLKRTLKVIGPPPAKLQETPGTSARASPTEDVSPVVSTVPLASDESLLEDIRPRRIGV